MSVKWGLPISALGEGGTVRSRAVSKPIITTLATPMLSRRTIQLSGVAAQKPLLLPLAMEVRLSISETMSVLKPLVCRMLVPLLLPLSLGPTEREGRLACCTGYSLGRVGLTLDEVLHNVLRLGRRCTAHLQQRTADGA